jgi:hypothetical protein
MSEIPKHDNIYHLEFRIQMSDVLTKENHLKIFDSLGKHLNEELRKIGYHLPSIDVNGCWYEEVGEKTSKSDIQKQMDKFNIAFGVALFCDNENIPVFSAEPVEGDVKIIIFYNPFYHEEEELEHDLAEFLLAENGDISYYFGIENFVMFCPIFKHLLFEKVGSRYLNIPEIEVERFDYK